jgi:ankyrin repeat protein
LDVVKYLLKHGVNIEDRDMYGRTALYIASEVLNYDAVKQLLQNGANMETRETHGGSPPLLAASAMGNVPIVQRLQQHGADVSATNFGGMTALHFAVAFGRVDMVHYLLQNDAANDSHMTTCNTDDCTNDTLNCVDSLRDHDTFDDVMTTLQLAVEGGRADIVKQLMQNLV